MWTNILSNPAPFTIKMDGRLQIKPREHRCTFPNRKFRAKEYLMPFKNVSDLPGAITDNLPKHGQEIYLAAFNSAWNEYKDKDDRRQGATREETAHKVAWAAVK